MVTRILQQQTGKDNTYINLPFIAGWKQGDVVEVEVSHDENVVKLTKLIKAK